MSAILNAFQAERESPENVGMFLYELFASMPEEAIAHSLRVGYLAQRLLYRAIQNGAKWMSAEEVRDAYFAIALHDIGKAMIPRDILMRQRKLNLTERRMIYRHAELGENILRDTLSLLPKSALPRYLPGMMIEAAANHHERWDGKGYPSKKRKENIPYIARVTAVSDCFDAMHRGRSYQEPKPIELILRELDSEAGKQFDPVLVKACAGFDGVFEEADFFRTDTLMFLFEKDLARLFPSLPLEEAKRATRGKWVKAMERSAIDHDSAASG